MPGQNSLRCLAKVIPAVLSATSAGSRMAWSEVMLMLEKLTPLLVSWARRRTTRHASNPHGTVSRSSSVLPLAGKKQRIHRKVLWVAVEKIVHALAL